MMGNNMEFKIQKGQRAVSSLPYGRQQASEGEKTKVGKKMSKKNK